MADSNETAKNGQTALKHSEQLDPRLISICILTYNRPQLLLEALDSCFAQTYPHYEVKLAMHATSISVCAYVLTPSKFILPMCILRNIG